LTEREPVISSDLAIHLDQAFFLPANLKTFLPTQGVSESLLKQNAHWDALSQLVWTWRWSGSIHTLKFAEVPVLWCRNSFHAFSLTFIALNNKETTQIRILFAIELEPWQNLSLGCRPRYWSPIKRVPYLPLCQRFNNKNYPLLQILKNSKISNSKIKKIKLKE